MEVIVPKDWIFEERSRNKEFSNIILRESRREWEGKSLAKIWDKYLNRNPQSDENLIQVPQLEPRSSEKGKEQDTPQSTDLPPSKKKGSRTPTKRCPGATFKEIGEEIQAGHTHTPSENINNQTRTGKEITSRGGRHRNVTGKKTRSGIPNTFKGIVQRLVQCSVTRTRTIRRATKTC